MLRGARCKGCLLLLSLVAALFAAAAVLTSDRLLNHGFDKALALSRAGLSFDLRAGKRNDAAATTGDEGFWLTQADVQSPAPFAKGLAIGDRITIAGSDGRERRLEVVDLKAVGGASRAAATHGRLLLVSCRVTSSPAEPTEATVRFLVEAGTPGPSIPAPAKAL